MSDQGRNEGFTVGGMLITTDDPATSPPPSPPSPPPQPVSPPGGDAVPQSAPPPGASSQLSGNEAVRRVLQLDESLELAVKPWVRVPNDLKFPRGRKVRFLRFPSRWTDVPAYGHEMPDFPGLWRQCILWSLSPGDEQLAAERALGNEQRFSDELVKQAIRAIDGLPVDQTGNPVSPQNVERFWAQLGAASRHLLKTSWSAMSTTTREQRLFFWSFCVAQSVG